MAMYQGPVGNYYDKFNTTNPIARKLMNGFRQAFMDLFQKTAAKNVLEIGCGEGEMLRLMSQMGASNLMGFDVEVPILLEAQKHSPNVALTLTDAHKIAYKSKAFELVMACEVLEHIPYPEQVLAEAKRVSQRYAIFSVPREPIWRVLNMARGRYWGDLGNTPGHIQHWSSQSFVRLVEKHFRVLEVRQPLPWTMLLCELP
jgi:ubiquinone/menaquinone biosynthesis C-methylase UbiE